MNYNIQKVRLISFLFIFLGTREGVDFIARLVIESTVAPSLELALLPVGIGILLGNNRWRQIGVVLVILNIALALTIPILALTVSPVYDVTVFGRSFNPDSNPVRVLLLVQAGIYVAALIWILRALRNGEVVKQFAG